MGQMNGAERLTILETLVRMELGAELLGAAIPVARRDGHAPLHDISDLQLSRESENLNISQVKSLSINALIVARSNTCHERKTPEYVTACKSLNKLFQSVIESIQQSTMQSNTGCNGSMLRRDQCRVSVAGDRQGNMRSTTIGNHPKTWFIR